MSIDEKFVRIGKINSPHGLDGKIKVEFFSSLSILEEDRFVSINIRGFNKEFEVIEASNHKGNIFFVKLMGVDDRKAAEALMGLDILISLERAESFKEHLDDDSFFFFDLIGKEVYLNNKLFGIVKDIIEAGSGEILLIKKESEQEYMVPFVSSMVDTSRLEEGRIDIDPVEGLIEDQEN